MTATPDAVGAQETPNYLASRARQEGILARDNLAKTAGQGSTQLPQGERYQTIAFRVRLENGLLMLFEIARVKAYAMLGMARARETRPHLASHATPESIPPKVNRAKIASPESTPQHQGPASQNQVPMPKLRAKFALPGSGAAQLERAPRPVASIAQRGSTRRRRAWRAKPTAIHVWLESTALHRERPPMKTAQPAKMESLVRIQVRMHRRVALPVPPAGAPTRSTQAARPARWVHLLRKEATLVKIVQTDNSIWLQIKRSAQIGPTVRPGTAGTSLQSVMH